MKKQYLAKTIAHKHNLKITVVENIINDIFDNISTNLIENNNITIPKFGKFIIYNSKARKMMNNFTKKPLVIPAKRIIKFKTDRQLKISLNLVANNKGIKND